MRILKILNNNVVIAQNANGNEQVVIGRGLAFQKKIGEKVDESKIEKIFLISNHQIIAHMTELLNQIPLEELTACSQIIQVAEKKLGKLHDMLYVSLTDHCHYAIERYKQGVVLSNAMMWEIKRFYPREYLLGLEALEILKTRLAVDLPIDEAGFIAIHLVNAQNAKEIDNSLVQDLSKIMQDILQLVKYQLHIDYDEESPCYQRFITHLRFFIQRLLHREMVNSNEDDFYHEIKKNYPKVYACVDKINDYLFKKYNQEMSKDEKMFLTIHIEKIRRESADRK